jgi:DNA-binding NarL/FixJ family response regulator
MPIRIVLAEDNALLRQGLARLLSSTEDLELVAAVDSYDALMDAVGEHDPDVVVSDIRMPPTSTDEGIRAAVALRTERPQVGVVVLSQHADAIYASQLLEGGSGRRAYLLKERVADAGELAAAVRQVHAGGSVIDPSVVEQLVAAGSRSQRSAIDLLTPRELEVLEHMAQGKNNASIASALVLTERAIEKHTNAIFTKLGISAEPDLNRRVTAVLVYLQSCV